MLAPEDSWLHVEIVFLSRQKSQVYKYFTPQLPVDVTAIFIFVFPLRLEIIFSTLDCRIPHHNSANFSTSVSSSQPLLSTIMGDPSPDTSTAPHHTQYRLRVTAGPDYDPSTHKTVPVNSDKTLSFETPSLILSLCVRIRHFTGFPPSSPVTSETYFTSDLHKYDQYSISFSFIPKKDIPGEDLVFGNDFDRPLRDRLPPGANQALRIVKWWIDPGLDGDMYADRPYLYGPALSSWNTLHIGDQIIPEEDLPQPQPSAAATEDTSNSKDEEEDDTKEQTHTWKDHPHPSSQDLHATIISEGCSGSGCALRTTDLSIPPDSAARKKHFLTPQNLSSFTFERGRLYQSDFSNGYLDFNDFSLKLPGFSLNVIGYVDAKTHELRYTLKNRRTGEVYAIVLFTLLFGEELRAVEREYGAASNVDGGGDREEKIDKESEENIPEDEDDVD